MKVTRQNNQYNLTEVSADELEILIDGIVALKNNHIPKDPEFSESRRTCVAMVNEIENCITT